MNEQDVFNTVARHLLTQQRQAKRFKSVDVCAYHSPDGLKCAVGCLIPDRLYGDWMEGFDFGQVLNRLADETYIKEEAVGYSAEQACELDNLLRPHSQLLKRLQNLHDLETPSMWRQGLADIGKHFSLNIDALMEFA